MHLGTNQVQPKGRKARRHVACYSMFTKDKESAGEGPEGGLKNFVGGGRHNKNHRGEYHLNWNTKPLQTILLPPEPQDSVFQESLCYSPLPEVGWPREDDVGAFFHSLQHPP